MTKFYILLTNNKFLNVSTDDEWEAQELSRLTGGRIITGEERNRMEKKKDTVVIMRPQPNYVKPFLAPLVGARGKGGYNSE